MTLSEGDKNTCREIAREIIKEVLIQHIESCPHGKSILTSKALIIGLCLGSGFAGGGLAIAFAQFIFRVVAS
jgi:hypothetical protein